MGEKLIWQDRALAGETPRDAAERFVRESFDADRAIRWGGTPGEFSFPDGYHTYRITSSAGVWSVCRTDRLTPAARARAKARREGQSDVQ